MRFTSYTLLFPLLSKFATVCEVVVASLSAIGVHGPHRPVPRRT